MTLLDEIAGAIGRGAQITLILGAGLTQPAVPGLTGIVELADRYAAGLGDDGELTQALHQAREELGPRAAPIEVYLAYRRVFTARRSPGEFDVVAQQAVLAGYRAPDLATTPLATHGIWQRVDLRLGERVENSLDWWELPPGVRAVGRLLAWRPDEFGNGVVLTTNVDPLVEVAVRLTGRQAVSVPVDAAGRPDRRPEGDGTVQVIHLHGFWRPVNETDRSPLLHDPAPSVESFEASRAIAELITGDRVVVVGYSGWDDVITGALRAVRAVRPVRVLWALQDDAPPPDLAARVGDLVTFYPGVDADELFTGLADRLQVPATVPRPDPRRRVRHLDWERELFSQPGNVVPDGVLPLLRQLERRYGWGVDWAGDPQPPRLLFWPVRLRGRASLINAVQALGAAALSERGVRVVICLDDFGVTDRAELGAAFADDLRRWMRRVDPAAGPAVVSLHDYIEDPQREPSLLRPTDPWSVARIFYGERNPSLYSVLAAIKVVPHLALHDLEQHAAAIVQTLLSKDANRLLTPLTTWAYLHHLLETEPAAEVMAYAGSDERLLWEQFREHFGLGGTLLYNPYIRHLTNESRMVRWSTPAELREYLASTRELPGWGEEGGYVHWLVQNAFLLPRYLTRAEFPELGGYRLDSWVAFAAALDKGAPVLDLLAEDVSAFYLPAPS
ncbi:SIR2 family protein [Dactylosporangium sp. NPDC005572]|uniref:SIR2 family protein n=1 Tax=Dactylosporangium sp. NPDC005572 TaxID=3156889 RepID=UPI0033ACBE53